MIKRTYAFDYDVYDSISALNKDDAVLLKMAQEATALAYAPYSDFKVGAVARMQNGELVKGSNQENASFPAGLCAEGVVMATAVSVYPGVAIDTLAVSYKAPDGHSDHPISPCGICRQSMQEFSLKTGSPIRMILGGMKGEVYVIEDAGALMPFAFSKDELRS